MLGEAIMITMEVWLIYIFAGGIIQVLFDNDNWWT